MKWFMAGPYADYPWPFVWISDRYRRDLSLWPDYTFHESGTEIPINTFTEVM